MKRAAVLIGVDKTGGLPKLADAAAGAERMEAWALGQGMARKDVVLFTDRAGPVEIKPIKRAIARLVEAGSFEQLVIYFAGHGVNIRYGEFWLLSEAPGDPDAAVNVDDSETLARYCGIPHVVFVSDACRTAAQGVQGQGIRGSSLFPNDPGGGDECPVDLFFATAIGDPALEVRDAAAASATFRALYTDALLDVASGLAPGSVVAAATGTKPSHVIRPKALRDAVRDTLPRRIAALGLTAAVAQKPSARITSDENAWIVGFDSAPPPTAGATRSSARAGHGGAAPGADPEVRTGQILAEQPAMARPSASSAVFGRTRGAPAPIRERPPTPPRAVPFGPGSFETRCGFKIRGGRVSAVHASRLGVERFDDDPTLVRVVPRDGRAGLVLLVLGDGSGVLLPAIPDWIAAVEVAEEKVVGVAWEPSEGTPGHADFVERADEIRRLRAVVADAARDGVFRLDPTTGAALAERMRSVKSVDPSLGLYAAYAMHQMQATGTLPRMADALRDDLGIALFDLELLARRARGEDPLRLPPFPLLQQGWNVLNALGATLPAALAPLRGELVDALWTQFTPAGVDRLRRLVEKGLL